MKDEAAKLLAKADKAVRAAEILLRESDHIASGGIHRRRAGLLERGALTSPSLAPNH
jgi:hypothetical protein